MMIKPSVAELLEKVDNRYMLVIATSKRARQIAQGAEVLVKTDDVAPDSIAADEIDAGNWDKVYDYFLQFLDQECKKRYIRVLEIQADLTRFLLDSGINPLEGQDYMPGFTFYGEFKLEDIPEIPSSIKEIKPFAYSELVTHKPMELRIPGTVKKIGGNAINSCKEITKIIIEDGVK